MPAASPLLPPLLPLLLRLLLVVLPFPLFVPPPFCTPSLGSAEGLQAGSLEPLSPSPASLACQRRHAPRPRPSVESPPHSPARASRPAIGLLTRPNRGKHAPRRAPRVIPGSSPGIQSSSPNPSRTRPKCTPPRQPSYPRMWVSHPPPPHAPQTQPKSTPRRLKSFFQKTLEAREAPAQHPANTPSVPAPSPGPSAGHMPHARGTCQPIPVAPMGRPALSLAPPSARSFRASEARNLAQKNPPKPSLASPSPLGTGWRETVPPFTPTPLRPTPTPPSMYALTQVVRPSPPKVGPDMPALALTGGTPVRTEPFPAWPVFPEQDIAALANRLRAGDRSDDDPVIEFEQAFAAAHDARYGIGLNSGTSALEIALQALRLDRGAEVIVSPITFFASVSAILERWPSPDLCRHRSRTPTTSRPRPSRPPSPRAPARS